MKRGTFLLGGVAGSAATLEYTLSPPSSEMLLDNYRILPGRMPILIERNFGWRGSDFSAGGTKGLDTESLPAPIFRQRPNCITTLANIIGPCDASNVRLRVDISEGHAGLPMRRSVRVVDAASCQPHDAAEVQIWHADARVIYPRKDVSSVCTFGDPQAISGLALRGRQVTDRDGVADFMTIFPGWYDGRTIHVHIRVIVGGRETLVSQLFFDDLLSDAIYSKHPNYARRPIRTTRNDRDFFLPRASLNDHIFDFEKLEVGVLQATYTIDLAS